MATSSLCKSCKIGFGLAIDGRLCIDNSLNTLKCARYDTDGKTCKDCISGWGLDPISK